MFRKYDILIYDALMGVRIIYIMEMPDKTHDQYTVAEVTLDDCSSANMNLEGLKGLGLIKHLDNKKVSPMEIMNLTDYYPEYFI